MTLLWWVAKIFMTTLSHTSKTVFGKLTQPLNGLVDRCKSKRNCKTLSDQQWIQTGILRTLSQESSGRAFIQKLLDIGQIFIKRSHFFETLKSRRRFNLVQEVNLALYDKLKTQAYHRDPFAEFAELDDYDIHAGDGHYHAAAAHDIKKSNKKIPIQHFYSVNLRTGGLNHLTLADTSGTRKREHDMRALKRLDTDKLRQTAPTGRKVLYIWDRAGIDFRQWFNWKHAAGIYFISREKKNMDLMIMGNLPYDSDDITNRGVESFQMAGTSTGVMTHRIVYQCPLSGERFHFLTNLTTVPPGLVAYLYKTRWDIEKIFDQIKNKLNEKKAWATTNTAKNMQAQFICLAHNLMLILENKFKNCGIENKTENTRRQKRLDKSIANANECRRSLPIFLRRTKKPAQRSVKFIRWLRNNLFTNTSWRKSLLNLKLVYDTF